MHDHAGGRAHSTRVECAPSAGAIWGGSAGGPDAAAQVLGGINGQSLTAAARAAGVDGRITGHSGRVGLAVELTRRGAPEQATAKAGGWKSSRMVAHYAAAVAAEQGAVATYERRTARLSPGCRGDQRTAGAGFGGFGHGGPEPWVADLGKDLGEGRRRPSQFRRPARGKE